MNTAQYRRRFLPAPGTDIATWTEIGDAHQIIDVHVGFWGTIAECGQISVRAERIVEHETVEVADPLTTFSFEMTPFGSDAACTSDVPPNVFDLAWGFTDGRHIDKRRTRYAVTQRARRPVLLDIDDFRSHGAPFRILEFTFGDPRDRDDFAPPALLLGREVTDDPEYAEVTIANRQGFPWAQGLPADTAPDTRQADNDSSHFDALWQREEHRAPHRRYHYGGPHDGAPVDDPDHGTGTGTGTDP